MHFNIFYEILHYKSYFALKFMQKILKTGFASKKTPTL
jgi:hypothetical protein